jgi:hypothetical protein
MMNDHPVEQAIRRSHCAHAQRDDPSHACVGSCHITPQGLTLTCKACGNDERPITPAEVLPETKLVRTVLAAVGIDYDAIAAERRADAVETAKRWMRLQR